MAAKMKYTILLTQREHPCQDFFNKTNFYQVFPITLLEKCNIVLGPLASMKINFLRPKFRHCCRHNLKNWKNKKVLKLNRLFKYLKIKTHPFSFINILYTSSH